MSTNEFKWRLTILGAAIIIAIGLGVYALAEGATQSDAHASSLAAQHYRACETLPIAKRQDCIEGKPHIIVKTVVQPSAASTSVNFHNGTGPPDLVWMKMPANHKGPGPRLECVVMGSIGGNGEGGYGALSCDWSAYNK